MDYDKETKVTFNKSVNEFYIRFLFKIDSLLQDMVLPLGVYATFFNNLSTKVREFLISEGFQVPPRPITIHNHQGNQRLLLVRDAAVEAEKKIITIKVSMQPASGSRHYKTFVGMLAGNPSTQMAGLGSRFRSEESNYMAAETM